MPAADDGEAHAASDAAEIARRFTLSEQTVVLPDWSLALEKPRNSDDLISEADYAKDERLPYWADLWRSAEILSSYLITHRSQLLAAFGGAGRPRSLELGCGLGLVSIVAQRVGFDALATDYYDDALLFVRHNARRALGAPIATRLVDWNAIPADLGQFELLLGADLLYEMRYAGLLADVVARTLAPEGVMLLGDQGRIGLQAFLGECEARGLRHEVLHREAAPVGEQRPSITLYALRWRR
ncbi:MAG: hypothetical protein KF709_03640 [Gemmatimonadaceae bacterium]|nr:hypothetical protein [Gemmatimonadaceae bacterium]